MSNFFTDTRKCKTSSNEKLLEILSKRVEDGEEVETIKPHIPTELNTWPFLIKSLSNDNENETLVKILWIQNLIMNPFNIFQIISLEEVDIIKRYILRSLEKFTKWTSKKQSLKTLSFLVKDMIRWNCGNKTEDECGIFEKVISDKTHIFDIEISERAVFCFLKYLSIIYEFPEKYKALYTKIDENDMIGIQRYKIKILSFQCTKNDVMAVLKDFISMLNVENSKFGYTLCKSIHRISRFIDKKLLIIDLSNLLKNEIFCNEQLWINSMMVISFLVIDDTDASDLSFDFIKTAVLFDKEFVSKSASIRETGLFLSWSLIRASVDIKQYLNEIVFASFFDRDYNCRKAASAVIQEFAGRSTFINKNALDVGILLKINQDLVKRRTNSINVFMLFENKEQFKKMLINSLYSFDFETRKLSAIAISKSFNIHDVPIRCETPVEKDATHQLIFFCLDNEKLSKDEVISYFSNAVNGFILDLKNFKFRNMNHAIESYLKIAQYFSVENYSKNILFLINKGFNPFLISCYSKSLFNNSEISDFDKRVFELIKKNNTGILINSNNQNFRDSVLLRLKNNLKEHKSVEYTILALYLMNHISFDDVFNLAVEFSDDYEVDYNGDSGYYNRRASLIYFSNVIQNLSSDLENGNSNSIDNEKSKIDVRDLILTMNIDILEKTFIRFLADKSKRLRDEIICSLVEDQFNEWNEDFSYLRKYNQESSYIKIPIKIEKYISEFESFFRMHSTLIQENDYEYAFFKSLVHAFSSFDEFWIGIIHTFNTGDRKLKSMLNNEIFSEICIEKIKKINNLKFKQEIEHFLNEYTSFNQEENENK